MKKTAVVILNWNRSQETIDLLERFLDLECDNCDVIVVDNRSCEEERLILRSHFLEKGLQIINEPDIGDSRSSEQYPPATLVFLKENYGYAKGNNYGLRLAEMRGYEFCLISNSDVFFDKPLIKRMESILESDRSVAVVGPRIVDLRSNTQGPFWKPGLMIDFWYQVLWPILWLPRKLVLSLIRAWRRSRTIVYPYRVFGCFMLLRSSAISEVGYFDEKTFLYAEELILSEKLVSKGYRTAYVDDVNVTHAHGTSTQALGERKRFQANLSSDLYYYREYRHYGPLRLKLVEVGRKAMCFIWMPLVKWFSKLLQRR